MIVGIDAKELSKGRAGIAVYIRTMIDWFHKLENDNQYILFSGKDFEMNPSWTRCKKVIYKIHTTGSFEVAYGLNKLIEEYKVDVFWGPEHCIPLKKSRFKKIVTIHDIAVIINPAWGTTYNSILQKFLVKRSVKAADEVVAISQSTKNDLIDKIGVFSEKIHVIYNGDSPYNYKTREYSLKYEKIFRNKYKIPGKFFLYCGTIEPRKNILSIVKAFEEFYRYNDEDFRLVLTGGLGWKYEPIVKRIKESHLTNKIIMTGYVTEEEKEFLYRNAEAFVFPSYYEGLGLPILEALSVGTPVITARNSSLMEVGGNVSYYVDFADDYKQIATYMNEIHSLNKEERYKISKESIIQARRFNKQECAKKLLNEFNKIMG